LPKEATIDLNFYFYNISYKQISTKGNLWCY